MGVPLNLGHTYSELRFFSFGKDDVYLPISLNEFWLKIYLLDVEMATPAWFLDLFTWK